MGYLAQYRGRSIVSKLIRWQSWGPYSHSAWLCDDGSVWESNMSKHGKSRGLGNVPSLSTTHTPGTVVDLYVCKGLTRAREDRMLSWFEANAGLPYDWKAITRFVTRRWRGSDQAVFCTEAVIRAMIHAGYHVIQNVEPWQVSPSALTTHLPFRFETSKVTA